jgi:hypothetical protein
MIRPLRAVAHVGRRRAQGHRAHEHHAQRVGGDLVGAIHLRAAAPRALGRGREILSLPGLARHEHEPGAVPDQRVGVGWLVASSSSQRFMPLSSLTASPRNPAKKSARTISSKRGDGSGVFWARGEPAKSAIPETSKTASTVALRLGLIMVVPPRDPGSTGAGLSSSPIGRTARIRDEGRACGSQLERGSQRNFGMTSSPNRRIDSMIDLCAR